MSGKTRRSLVLVGFMGAGKTTVGRRVASRLDRPFVDSDERVEQCAGAPVARIFAESGERRFRRLEQEQLAKALVETPAPVIAAGGGALDSVGNRRAIAARALTIWLDLPLAVAAARLGPAPSRPLWTPDDHLGLRALFERRRAVYALARIRVAAWPGGPDEVAESVEVAFRRFFVDSATRL